MTIATQPSDSLTIDDIVRDLPAGMREIERPMTGKAAVDMALLTARWWTWGPLGICVSIDDCGADGLWLHTSVSCRGLRRLPTWEELARVKGAVHGERLVVQILPPRAQYVNIAEVLHLWERLDAPTLPSAVAKRTG